jgi:protein involved in polysaccharide export with SLBB domain
MLLRSRKTTICVVLALTATAVPRVASLPVAAQPAAAASAPDAAAGGAEPAAGAISFSGSNQRAPWQKRLTLGPGDEIRIEMYGGTGTGTPVTVGMDGRINYLQARDLMVTGLTIDELRAKLDEELAKYYLAARTMIQPLVFRSKKYYILGKGAGRGVFVLDRPKTLVEAVAQAGGLSLGTFEGNTVELADLQRSFFVRGGKQLTVNFESLFLQGDLSQNILMEPEDYVFIAAADANEIFVTGEVLNPGVTMFVPNASILAVIASRGGFNTRAYRQKVLIVRGSLTNPTTILVNVADMLKAKGRDIPLQPKDIVYVARKPWYRPEEILQYAVDSFVYGAVYTYSRDLVNDVEGNN